MKRFCLVLLVMAFVFSNAVAQEKNVPLKNGWALDFSTAIPLFKIIESEDGGSRMDVVPMIGIGGGLTFYWGPKDDPDNKKLISINIPTLVLNERETSGTSLDLTLVFDVGFLNNKLRLGGGYEFGKLNYSRSRFIAVFSFGVEF